MASRQLASRPSYNRDVSYALASLDVQLPSGGAYLSMGLNNDYDASYYWARHAGSNARRPVPGIDLRADSSGFAEIVRLTEEEFWRCYFWHVANVKCEMLHDWRTANGARRAAAMEDEATLAPVDDAGLGGGGTAAADEDAVEADDLDAEFERLVASPTPPVARK